MKALLKTVLIVTFSYSYLITISISSELNHNFKNPAFSGNGYSNHVLSVDQLQSQRKKDNEVRRALC